MSAYLARLKQLDAERKVEEAQHRPSDAQLIALVAKNYGVTFGTACDWVIEAAERMKVAA